MSRPQPPGSSQSRYIHRVGQCAFCNLTAWLKMIQKHMTGLRSVEVFLYLDKKMAVPQMGQSWVVDLLKLQKAPDGRLRTMQVKVYSNADEVGLALQSDYKKAASDFMKGLRKEIRRNAGSKETRTTRRSAAGSLLSPIEELGKGESGAIGPLRSVQTPVDDL